MRKTIYSSLLVLIAIFVQGCVSAPRDTVSQVSTIDALLAGVYTGKVTLDELTDMGDTGIGTFDSLDGEMVVLDGKVYQVKADGKVYTPPMSETTPFASVVRFTPERRIIMCTAAYPRIIQMLDKIEPNHNIFYAFRITGKFSTMKTRSVPRQKQPFPPLAEVVKHQPVFNMENISGTVVGFRCPPFVKGINVPGYHLHFISDDRTQGGHVIDFTLEHGSVLEIDRCNKFFMVLPQGGTGFENADLKRDRSRELQKVEK